MDGRRFDDLTRSLGTATNRRRLLRNLAALAVGGLFAHRTTSAADAACRSGSRRCATTAAATSCPPGQVAARGTCRCRATGRPPTVDPACGAGQIACQGCCVDECRGGAVREPARCACVCPPELEACGRGCVDPVSYQTDPANCGGCGAACPTPGNANAFCDGGQCGFVCLPGFRPCAGSCIPEDGCCTDDECPAPAAACQAAAICVDNVCGYSPAPAGTVCRPAVGVCDVAEVCDGVGTACPPDRLAAATTVCRPGAGPCEAAAFCTGTSVDCPPNELHTVGTRCRDATDPCHDDAVCTGASAFCPPNPVLPDGTPCGPSCQVCESGTCSGITGSALGVFCETDEECCQEEPTICAFNAAGDPGRRCTHPAGGTCRTPVDCALPNGCFPDGICRV